MLKRDIFIFAIILVIAAFLWLFVIRVTFAGELQHQYHCYRHCYHGVTGTPTPTVIEEEPVATESAVVDNSTPSGVSDGRASDPGATAAPAVSTCIIPFEVARTWYDNGELRWATDAQGIQKFSITYGPSADQLIYGVDNIVPTARAIAKPESNWNQTWFSVYTWVNGCENHSEPRDP